MPNWEEDEESLMAREHGECLGKEYRFWRQSLKLTVTGCVTL